ncbi:MAG: hypothetical protein E6J14_02020 [Chloroflexi bacterium]|nr:MAG: hypothetical protein E6J14_02020 [Chloroflexota bacterium]
MAVVEAEDTIELLRESVRGTLRRQWPVDQAAGLQRDPTALRDAWQVAASQGWAALGSRQTAAWAVIVEETGRAACPLPLRDGAAVAAALGPGAGPATAVLEQVAAGTAAVAVAMGTRGGERAGGAVRSSALLDGQVRLQGNVRFVEGAGVITHLLLATDGEAPLALVESAAPGVTTVITPALAGPLMEVRFDDAAGTPLQVPASVVGDMQALLRLGCIARALGAAGRSFELAVDHARNRQQFGSPIGRFQAVQHRLSDGAIALDASRLLLRRAASARDSGEERWRECADAACAYAAPALRRVARDAQHVLAGVGYMEEHEAPRHFRRVFADTVRFGGAAAARARLGAASLDAAAMTAGLSSPGAIG